MDPCPVCEAKRALIREAQNFGEITRVIQLTAELIRHQNYAHKTLAEQLFKRPVVVVEGGER